MAERKATSDGQDEKSDWLENPAIQRRIEKLRKLVQTPRSKELSWWCQVGEGLAALLEGREDRESRYRRVRQVVKLLWGSHSSSKAFLLRQARQLVTEFPDPAEREEIVEKLSLSHLRILLRLKKRGNRQRLAQMAIKKGWSCKDLTDEILRRNGGRGRLQGRPAKPKKITSPLLAVQELAIAARRWMVLDAGVSQSDEFLKNFPKTAHDKDQFRRAAETARDELKRVAKAIVAERKLVEQFLAQTEKTAASAKKSAKPRQ